MLPFLSISSKIISVFTFVVECFYFFHHLAKDSSPMYSTLIFVFYTLGFVGTLIDTKWQLDSDCFLLFATAKSILKSIMLVFAPSIGAMSDSIAIYQVIDFGASTQMSTVPFICWTYSLTIFFAAPTTSKLFSHRFQGIDIQNHQFIW